MATTETRAAFARRHGVNRSTVGRWEAKGSLVLTVDGLVNVEASEQLLCGRAETYRGGKVKGPSARKDRPSFCPDPGHGSVQDRPQGLAADGGGRAAREKARKAFEAMQKGEGRLDASAGRAGVVGGPHIENNGSVSVVVQRPGPDTNVRTSTAGNLFKDVVLRKGRTMASAGGG